ncbi:MAG: hypothetical protein AAFO62_12075, partial [Pseudomonadota bacterium]
RGRRVGPEAGGDTPVRQAVRDRSAVFDIRQVAADCEAAGANAEVDADRSGGVAAGFWSDPAAAPEAGLLSVPRTSVALTSMIALGFLPSRRPRFCLLI